MLPTREETMATRTAAPPATRRPGFQTLDEEVRVDRLALHGELPEWLAGTLMRVTPAMQEIGGRTLRHWFDGLAMLNAFSFAGGEVSYGSRYLRTEAYREAQEGRIGFRGFAEDPCRSLFKRAMALVAPPRNDNANVNLVKLGERYLAMTELPLPVEFEPEMLETLGLGEWKDRLGGHVTTAHPHHDRARDEMVNYVTHFGPRSSYRVFAVPAGSTSRRLIAKVPVREPGYMHSFAMSERYVVLAEYPLVVNPLRLGLSGKPFIDNYRWEPERGTRFIVLDRHSGELRTIAEGEPFFCFHHVNAFERNGELVVDLVAYEDAEIIRTLELERLRDPSQGIPTAELRRYRVPLDGRDASGGRLADAGPELPRIDYGAVNGRDYRYVYGVAVRGPESDFVDRLVKIDVRDGRTWGWSEDGCYPGEPVFVRSPDGPAEEGGVVLSVVLDAAAERSFLLVLDAMSFEELARAEAPHAVPFGFHGQFFGEKR
jgi:beta,beta-carotene 9',10'-dioxygenase